MKTWTLSVKISVADSWVADGFNMKERKQDVAENLLRLLPFAYGHEVKIAVTVTDGPSARVINGLQNGKIEIKD